MKMMNVHLLRVHPPGWHQLSTTHGCSRWRSRQSSACRLHVEQHHGHRRGVGQVGPQVWPDVRQEGFRALVSNFLKNLKIAFLFFSLCPVYSLNCVSLSCYNKTKNMWINYFSICLLPFALLMSFLSFAFVNITTKVQKFLIYHLCYISSGTLAKVWRRANSPRLARIWRPWRRITKRWALTAPRARAKMTRKNIDFPPRKISDAARWKKIGGVVNTFREFINKEDLENKRKVHSNIQCCFPVYVDLLFLLILYAFKDTINLPNIRLVLSFSLSCLTLSNFCNRLLSTQKIFVKSGVQVWTKTKLLRDDHFIHFLWKNPYHYIIGNNTRF